MLTSRVTEAVPETDIKQWEFPCLLRYRLTNMIVLAGNWYNFDNRDPERSKFAGTIVYSPGGGRLGETHYYEARDFEPYYGEVRLVNEKK